MKFCKKCKRSIKKKISMGTITFQCICGNLEEVNPEDVLISTPTTNSTENKEMYSNLISLAPFDRTNQLVEMDCPNCGLDYLTQVRITSSEIVIYICKCGYQKIVE